MLEMIGAVLSYRIAYGVPVYAAAFVLLTVSGWAWVAFTDPDD